jgi:hypothetical protein
MAKLDVAALFGRRVCAEEQRQIDGLWIEGCDLRKRPLLLFVEAE